MARRELLVCDHCHATRPTRPQSQRAVARLLGIPRAKVQQIERMALEKLRRSPVMRELARELFGWDVDEKMEAV